MLTFPEGPSERQVRNYRSPRDRCWAWPWKRHRTTTLSRSVLLPSARAGVDKARAEHYDRFFGGRLALGAGASRPVLRQRSRAMSTPTKQVKKCVLAYSGGLDTSVIIRWLIENYGCEVVAFSADLGQGEDLAPLKKKAIATGASKIIIQDLRDEFARDFLALAIHANAIYEGKYPLATALGRPLIAKHL